METIKSQVKSLTTCPIGAAVGAIGFFFLAKKAVKIQNKWAIGGLVIVGALVGAAAEYKIKASRVKPTAAAKK